jgi:predicted ATPase/DNA-binding CsgD family transcriptional regulator
MSRDPPSNRLRSVPPPLSSRRPALASLPAPLTPLVGREREAVLAISLLRREEVRLITLTGPAGVGKTRLAIRVAAEASDAFADGVRFVPLAALPDAGLVATTIAREFGLVEAGGTPVPDRLVAALRDAELLLVLDNFEHLLAAAPLLTDLLAGCPLLKILTTSRALLRLAGERALPVPPLDLPDPEASQSLEHLSRSAAVQLFVDRAQAVDPAFALTAVTAPLVAEICRLLDGLPLAIELAAAQVSVLPPAVLRARIEARLPLPVISPRDAPARLRSVRDAVAWSYGLLSIEEQALFRRFGVFVGGFGLDAAEFVGGLRAERRAGTGEGTSSAGSVPSVDSVFDGLVSLVDRSLVRQEPWEDEPRFSMLETVRGFALEQLAESGEADAVSGAHAAWCLDLAEGSSLATTLPGSDRQLRLLEAEHANLRAALEWLDRRGDDEHLLRLAAALGGFWYAHSHFVEGRRWLERALERTSDGAPGVATHARARALVELGHLLLVLGETARLEALISGSVAVLREHGDAVWATRALIWQGWIATQRGDHDRAERVLKEALGLAATIADPVVAATAKGHALANFGVAAHGRGDLDTARARHEEALRTHRAHGNTIGVIHSLRDLGDVARDQGDYGGSVAFYRECLALLDERDDLNVVVDALQGAALAAASWGQPDRAGRLLGAAEVVREQLGIAIALPTDRAAHERTVASVRAALGDDGLRRAWAVGRGLPLAAAIAEVQALAPPVAAERTDDRAGIKLSPREVEVLRLIEAGRSDREIAAALFISVRTAETHVARLLAKLGVRTRGEAVKAALAAGLTIPPATESSHQSDSLH